ncbi:MAG: ATP-binding protein [Candidatus Dormiibacterota bacterium]
MMATPVVFSWSAGKDSAYGLWTILQVPGYEVRALLTTLTEGYDRVSMSGVREDLLDRQAERLGLPLVKVWIPPACSNDVYEKRMSQAFAQEPLRSVVKFAFADLFLEDVRAYREERLAQVNREGVFPLWGRNTAALARDMIAAGIRATVVCVDPRTLPASFAGRDFDEGFLEDLPASVDPCGERGEFHTFVWDAPMYRKPIGCRTGEVVNRDGFIFCDVIAAECDPDHARASTPVLADENDLIPRPQ